MAGSLEQRIYSNQIRDFRKSHYIEVKRIEPTTLIEQWATELAGAIAWLESLGVVHGDLRPANILLDRHDHIKLADFDSVAKMGSRNPGTTAPWVQLRDCIELYEDMGPEALDLLKNLEFPELGDSPLDKLTITGWMGGFASLADLAMATDRLDGAQGANCATRFDDEYVNKMKAQCQELLEGKLAGIQFDVASAEAVQS
ncbi:hypothetical protein MY4038_010107 [Beauveria bassiana]